MSSEKDPAIAASFMRASTYTEATGRHVISMPKLDGLRCMWIPEKGFFSRDGKRWNDLVLAHIKPDAVTSLDGELYMHGMRLQEINSQVGVNRIKPGLLAVHIKFIVYDLPDSSTTALERMTKLSKMQLGDNTEMIDWTVLRNQEDLDTQYTELIQGGYEGQMIKSIYGVYIHQGKTKQTTINLQKRKEFIDNEFKCIGVSRGEGRCKDMVGALKFITNENVEFEVGTGFTDAQRIDWLAHPPIDSIATIKYLYLTQDGRPFNASFKQFNH
jgi:DNA ligase 1